MNSGGYQLTSAAPFVFIVFVLYSIGSYLLYLYSRAVVFIVPAEIEIQAAKLVARHRHWMKIVVTYWSSFDEMQKEKNKKDKNRNVFLLRGRAHIT